MIQVPTQTKSKMYSPNFNVNNYYELWNDNKSIYHQQQQPPLNAYSPEFPGASMLYMNPNTNAQDISALTQMKLNKMNMIRFYGYRSLRPIGVNKTLDQLDAERNVSAIAGHTVENEQGPDEEQRTHQIDHTNVRADEGNVQVDQGNIQVEQTVGESGIGDSGNQIDIDEDIPNYDSNDSDFDFVVEEPPQEPLGQIIPDDEGFMAEDVEYQPDHSQVPVGQAIGSTGPSSAITATTSATTTTTVTSNSAGATNSAVSTNATSLDSGSYVKQKDEEEDMVLDDLE